MIGKEDAAADSAVLWLEMVFIPRVFHRGTGAMRYALWDGDLWMDMDGYNPSKGDGYRKLDCLDHANVPLFDRRSGIEYPKGSA